ncbi:uncharacterized protein LOC122076931 isoform X4 [Macadamia integrifolia]|uniref:uncharacterized protein LOC122076931 isoform X4 n=1 Tax=Macadamia integrifolia TaxID=60698 RepID=UPI001C4FAAE9|nr:uncharacterized protein LOC122076931 isoform X4 [Macadamia integrifolia]
MVVCGTIEEFLFLGLVGDNQGLWMDVLIARGLQPRSLFADRESRTSSACGTIIILTKFMWGYELQALGIPFHATILFTYLRIFLSFIEVLLHNIKLNSLVYDTWISMFPLLGGSWDMLYLDERLCEIDMQRAKDTKHLFGGWRFQCPDGNAVLLLLV